MNNNGFQPWELGEYIESTVLQHKFECHPITQASINCMVYLLNKHTTKIIFMYLKY